MKEVDYGLYPSKETQLQWLHSYLQAYKELTQGHPGDARVSEEELETLYVQVNKFSLVSGRSRPRSRGENTTRGMGFPPPLGFQLPWRGWGRGCRLGGLGDTRGRLSHRAWQRLRGTEPPGKVTGVCWGQRVSDSRRPWASLQRGQTRAGVRKSSLVTARGGPSQFSGNLG